MAPLLRVPNPFEYFDPFKGAVPIPHQFEFADATERARALLNSWDTDSLISAAILVQELLEQGENLLLEEVRSTGQGIRTNSIMRITRAMRDRQSPLIADGKPMSDWECFAILTLLAVSEACTNQAGLERITDQTPDILAEALRDAENRTTAGLATLAKEAIERAERLHEVEERRRIEEKQRRQKARKAGQRRLPALKQYQKRFIDAYVSGQYGKCTKKKAIYEFTKQYPPEDEGLGKFSALERSLLEALRRYEKANPSPTA